MRSSASDASDEDACLNAVLGFSVVGLLAAVLLSSIPLETQFASLKFLLIVMAAPVAAWLGFTLGSSD